MPDVNLRYLPSHVRGRQIRKLEPEIQVRVGRVLGFPAHEIAIQRTRVKGTGLLPVDVTVYASTDPKVVTVSQPFADGSVTTTVSGIDPVVAQRFKDAAPLIAEELAALFEEHGLTQRNNLAGRPAKGISKLGVGSGVVIGDFSERTTIDTSAASALTTSL